MIRVLLVDDHMFTRVGIKFFIEKDPAIKVVGEATEAKQGIELFSTLHPDIVLLDINMPGLNGIDAAAAIISNNPQAKIIMLTGSGSEKEIRAALCAGAKGYCLKDIDYSGLIAIIRSVLEGHVWVDPSIPGIATVLNEADSPIGDSTLAASFGLSQRELQVLALVCEGKTNQQIADTLNVSPSTIKSHVKVLMEKLSVNDRTEAAVKAVREGLL